MRDEDPDLPEDQVEREDSDAKTPEEKELVVDEKKNNADDFERLERTFDSVGFRGCAFVNAVAELKDPRHAANEIALAFKEMRRQWFRELLKRAQVADPEGLSLQLMLLVDGAIAAALVRRDPTVARAAGTAARTLLAAAGVSFN